VGGQALRRYLQGRVVLRGDGSPPPDAPALREEDPVSLSRKRRRWRAWDRWMDRCIKLSHETIAPRGAVKALNQRAMHNFRRRDAR